MFYIATAHITATDEIRFRDRSALGVTVLTTGMETFDQLHINGSPQERADFLLRLASAASDAAMALVGETTEVA